MLLLQSLLIILLLTNVNDVSATSIPSSSLPSSSSLPLPLKHDNHQHVNNINNRMMSGVLSSSVEDFVTWKHQSSISKRRQRRGHSDYYNVIHAAANDTGYTINASTTTTNTTTTTTTGNHHSDYTTATGSNSSRSNSDNNSNNVIQDTSVSTSTTSSSSLWPPWPFSLLQKNKYDNKSMTTYDNNNNNESSNGNNNIVSRTKNGKSVALIFAKYLRQKSLIGLQQMQQGMSNVKNIHFIIYIYFNTFICTT